MRKWSSSLSFANADRSGMTFVGYRKLGEELGISKNTVQKAISELEASHHVGRYHSENGRPSHLRVCTVPNQGARPSHGVGPKEDSKEDFKEGVLKQLEKLQANSTKGQYSHNREALRRKWSIHH